MWKVVATILNLRLTASITFHDFLHGFRAGRCTGTATLEAKLLHKLADMRKEVLYLILLDLHKAYDALERSSCLEILEGYGVVPRACWFLQTYWMWLTMVARAGGYYGTTFQGARGVTKGYPLSSTIFNVVMDAVVRHWVAVVIVGVEERGKRGHESMHQAALFYSDYGMVDSSDPRWLQDAFNTLVGLFDRVGLRTNVGNKVSMVCRPFQAVGISWGRRTGDGSWGRDPPIGSYRRDGFTICSAGRRWRQDIWRVTR